MDANIKRALKALKPGDAIEIIWNDANTTAKWLEAHEAASCELSSILTRGTLVRADDEAVRIALDSSVRPGSKTLEDFHGVGTVDPGSITEVYRLERKRTRRISPGKKK